MPKGVVLLSSMRWGVSGVVPFRVAKTLAAACQPRGPAVLSSASFRGKRISTGPGGSATLTPVRRPYSWTTRRLGDGDDETRGHGRAAGVGRVAVIGERSASAAPSIWCNKNGAAPTVGASGGVVTGYYSHVCNSVAGVTRMVESITISQGRRVVHVGPPGTPPQTRVDFPVSRPSRRTTAISGLRCSSPSRGASRSEVFRAAVASPARR